MNKVLVVEDSDLIREQICSALKACNCEVIEGHDGMDGAEKFSKHSDIKVVISDVNMPRMNGLEMVDEIRKNPKGSQVPVFILTTETSPVLKNKGKELKIIAWIVKPFDPQSLRDGITPFLA